MDKLYCCFCAELKRPEKLLNLDLDAIKLAEIERELAIFKASFPIYTKDRNFIPKTACFVCCDALHKAYDFQERFKKAQVVLSSLYNEKCEPKCNVLVDESSDLLKERYSFNDDTTLADGSDDDDQPLSALESKKKSKSSRKKLKHEKVNPELGLLKIKSEPKEECLEADDSLNVQSFLDAAIGEVSLDPNATLYAKEVDGLPKKTIISWSEYPWLCQHCNIMFPTIEMLRNHSKELHKRCFAFVCIDCDESLIYSNGRGFVEFLNHVRRHRESLRYICPYCEVDYRSDPHHVQSHHPDPCVSCQHCGEILRNEKSLKKHSQDFVYIKPPRKSVKHRGQPLTVQDLTCDICHKVYKNLNSLRDHKKRHTHGERRRDYTCELCGKTYFTKGSLTSHILMSHENVRPNVCRICNKSFLFPNMLRRHVQMHSGVKPFSCEQCGRCFRFKRQLDTHQIVHTDSMPYVCKYCGKAFRFKPILQTHERQHTGARPYACKDCGLEFTNWSNYNKHMKRRHGTTTAKKKITPNGVFPIDPETGNVIQLDVEGCEEWKNEIMAPVKRGRKRVKTEIEGKNCTDSAVS